MTTSHRSVLAVLVLLLGAVVVAGLVLQRSAPPEVPGPGLDRARDASRAPPPDTEPGSVSGRVRVFRTDEPAAGVTVRIAGEGVEEEKSTATDGAFTFTVPSGVDFALTVEAPDPYAPVVRAGISVPPGRGISLGTLYLETAFVVRGEVVDADGAPLAGSAVRAYASRRRSGGTGIIDRVLAVVDRRVPDEAVTAGPDGTFAFRTLSPGIYTFEADAKGFAQTTLADVVVSPEALDRPVRLVLAPGTTLRGTVLDAEGRPVPDATVSVLRFDLRAIGEGAFSPVQTVTGEDGSYAFASLPRIEAAVMVSATGYPVSSEQQVDLEKREVLDFVLGGLAVVAGTVRDEAGAPVEGARITAIVPRDNGAVGRARTDADGAYRIDHMPEGTLQMLLVAKEGYAPWPSQEGMLGGMMGGRPRGELVAGETLTQDVTLSAGGVVTGTVRDSVTGRGVAGAEVRILDRSMFVGGGAITTVAGEDGAYRLAGVPPGTHALLVKAEGYETAGIDRTNPFQLMMGRGGGDGPFAVRVAQTGDRITKDLEITPGARISGRVTTPGGEPVASARVSVAAEAGPFGQFAALLGLGGDSVLTNATGEFLLTGVPSGPEVRLRAQAEGWVEGRSDALSLETGAEVKGVRIGLRQAGTVEGTVVDASGVPFPGASVRAVPKPTQGRDWIVETTLRTTVAAKSDGSGRFRVEGVAPGDVVVEASAPGCVPARREVHLDDGGATATVELRLEVGLEISGTVRGEDGQPLEGVAVSAWAGTPSGFRSVSPVLTGADGGFVLDGLAPGDYRLNVALSGFTTVGRDGIRAGTTGLVLEMSRGRAISGRVEGPDGKGLAGVFVSARGEGSNGGTVTQPDGTFRVQGLSDGEYTLTATQGFGGGGDLRGVSVTVSAGREDVVLRMVRGRTLSGVVVDEQGRPVPGATVFAIGGGLPSNARTDERGRFTLRGLGDDEVTIRVAHAGHATDGTIRARPGGPELRIAVHPVEQGTPRPTPAPGDGD